MAAFVRYQGRVRRARLSGGRFYKGEMYVTAEIEGFKIAKCIHFSSIISYDWSQMTKAA